ncbi:MAG: recombinase family protein [Clostridia bacterium]|nr:recombinase family protein [Clostridia bacterium]
MQSKKIIAACYCRLSDDDEQDGTSVSIETQKKILGDYCCDFGITDYTYFCDDGWTGTNFERPNFLRMMKEVEHGNINTVIVKDLSRFGRDYVKIGYYLSQYFPEHDIRFIAITENVDSARNNLDYDLMIPIKNVFNEFYPADCSHKVK